MRVEEEFPAFEVGAPFFMVPVTEFERKLMICDQYVTCDCYISTKDKLRNLIFIDEKAVKQI